MIEEKSISRLLVSLVVALMYLTTSSTAIVHSVSHETSNKPLHTASIDGDCFFCYHGPAVALVSIPASPPAPAAAYLRVSAIDRIDFVDARPEYSPPLRAPPYIS